MQFFHGTRQALKPGDLIYPTSAEAVPSGQDETIGYVRLTPDLDGATWEAELAAGHDPGRVYVVEPLGAVEDVSTLDGHSAPPHPAMSWRSRAPLRVTKEVTQWTLYHGTRADLKPGDFIKPGQTPNFGRTDITTSYVYFTRTLDAAIWGAELATGEGAGRIYIVEPTGPVEDDPNLTNNRFRGNPTKSFRSRHPLRVTGEVQDWQGHPPERIAAMKEGLKRLEQAGIQPLQQHGD